MAPPPDTPQIAHLLYDINTTQSGLFRNVNIPPLRPGALWRALFAFLIPHSRGAKKTVDLN